MCKNLSGALEKFLLLHRALSARNSALISRRVLRLVRYIQTPEPCELTPHRQRVGIERGIFNPAMLLWSWCLAAVMAGNPNKRPIDKKIEHLKRAGPDMVNMYFVEAKPDGNNPAHQKGTLKNQDRRKSVAGRLNVSLFLKGYFDFLSSFVTNDKFSA